MTARNPELTVTEPVQVPDEADGVAVVTVSIHPSEQPQLIASFDYLVKPAEVVSLTAFRLDPNPTLAAEERLRLGAGLIKDLPVARWERAARSAATSKVEGLVQWGWHGGSNDAEITEIAEAIVRAIYPDVDPSAGKAAARRWNRLVRLAEVVQQHDEAKARGAKSPAGEVAALRGVEASTVRSWLFQAKQEGLVPALMSHEELKERFPGLPIRIAGSGAASAT